MQKKEGSQPEVAGLSSFEDWYGKKKAAILLVKRKWGEDMEIGERLQQLRKEKGISQEKLAEQLHVTRQAVSKWETGVSLR